MLHASGINFDIERQIQLTRTSIVTTNNPPTEPPSPMRARQEHDDTTTPLDMNKTCLYVHCH